MGNLPQDHLSLPARALLWLLADASPARHEALALTRGEDWAAVVDLAGAHGVGPLLHRSIADAGTLAQLPPSLADRLREDRRVTALWNLRNYGELKRISGAVRAAGIEAMALKGLHLAELVYRDIGLRPMGDLDILVPRGRVTEVLALLRLVDYGFDADVADAAGAMVNTKCNVGVRHRLRGTWLEVHWSLGEPPQRYAEAIEAIWRTATPGRLGDARVAMMAPEFVLLHVCAHLACNHGFAFSLRALCDIREIVQRHPGLDWDLVIEHGNRHGWRRGVAAALRLADAHLHAHVPRRVLEALGADELEPALLAEAIQHLAACVDLPASLQHAPNLLAVAADRTSLASVALLGRRLFLPRAELALLYGVGESSRRWLPLFHAVRLWDLMRRYSGAAWKLTANRAVGRAAQRHARLAQWIREG